MSDESERNQNPEERQRAETVYQPSQDVIDALKGHTVEEKLKEARAELSTLSAFFKSRLLPKN
jgi:hypothetical protein